MGNGSRQFSKTHNGSFIATLRGSEKKNRRIVKEEGNWNERVGLPISTYNEAVFKQYKVNFNDI